MKIDRSLSITIKLQYEIFHTTRFNPGAPFIPIFWDPKTPAAARVAIRTLRSNSRRWGEVHISQWRGPRLVTRNHTPMDTWTTMSQSAPEPIATVNPGVDFVFFIEVFSFSSQKIGCGITHPTHPSDGSEISETSLFLVTPKSFTSIWVDMKQVVKKRWANSNKSANDLSLAWKEWC